MAWSKNYNVRPAGLSWRSSTFFIVATSALSLFSDVFLFTVVIPVFPFFLHDVVGVPEDQLQDVISLLLATMSVSALVTCLIFGIVADHMSTRQTPFVMALFAMGLATALLFSSQSIPPLIISRAVQGASGAAVRILALTLCLETVGPNNLGKTFGSISAFLTVSVLSGPVIGGFLYQHTGLLGLRIVCTVMIGIDAIARLLMIEKRVAKRYIEASADEPEQVGTTSGDDANEESPHEESDETAPLGSDEAAPLIPAGDRPPEPDDDEDLQSFQIGVERTGIYRVIPILPCLTNKRLINANWQVFMGSLFIGSFDVTVALHAKQLFGFNSQAVGLLFIPMTVCNIVLRPLFGGFIDKHGPKMISTVGYTLYGCSFFLLNIPTAGGTDQAIFYGGALALCGICSAMAGAAPLVESGFVTRKYLKNNPNYFGEHTPYAQIYGLSSFFANLGITAGTVLAGPLTERIGYGKMNMILSALAFVSAIPAYLYMGGARKW